VKFSRISLASVISKVMGSVSSGRIVVKGVSVDTPFTLIIDVVNLTITSCTLKLADESMITGVDCLNMLADVLCTECNAEVVREEGLGMTEGTVISEPSEHREILRFDKCVIFDLLSDLLLNNKEFVSSILKPTVHIGGSAGPLMDVINDARKVINVGTYLLYVRSRNATYYLLLRNGRVATAIKQVRKRGFVDIGNNVLKELTSLSNEMVALALYKVNDMKVPKVIRDLILKC